MKTMINIFIKRVIVGIAASALLVIMSGPVLAQFVQPSSTFVGEASDGNDWFLQPFVVTNFAVDSSNNSARLSYQSLGSCGPTSVSIGDLGDIRDVCPFELQPNGESVLSCDISVVKDNRTKSYQLIIADGSGEGRPLFRLLSRIIKTPIGDTGAVRETVSVRVVNPRKAARGRAERKVQMSQTEFRYSLDSSDDSDFQVVSQIQGFLLGDVNLDGEVNLRLNELLTLDFICVDD